MKEMEFYIMKMEISIKMVLSNQMNFMVIEFIIMKIKQLNIKEIWNLDIWKEQENYIMEMAI